MTSQSCHRQLNEVAHRLAKEVLILSEELIYDGDVPSCITDIIFMEYL
jgi:hypothetical protein